MKKVAMILIGIILCLVTVVGLSNNNSSSDNSEILRIHIRANSNSNVDQEIKYKIKNQLVDYMIPMLENIESKQDVVDVITKNKTVIEKYIDSILVENGFKYTSNLKITNEEFPTRYYNGVTFESGFYDALIVELGQAKGDNWWCVIYPPICFTNFNKNGNKVVYKSKIMEIINKILKRS